MRIANIISRFWENLSSGTAFIHHSLFISIFQGVNFCETRAQDEKIKEEAKEEIKNADEEEAIKNKILDASLAHVGQHGWTRMSLTAGAEDAGYVSLVSGLFPNEGSDLVFHHVKTSNQNLNDWMTKEVERLQVLLTV